MPARWAIGGIWAVLMAAGLLMYGRNAVAEQSRPPGMVQKVTFLGAKHLKPDELQKITGVRPGTPLNPNLNRQGCQKILAKYEEMGRSFSYCQLVKGGDLADSEVVYQITEGPKVKVRDIQFTGNTFISSARLVTKLKSSSQWFHLPGSTYNKEKAESDVGELYNYYRSFGYQDVKVALETQRSADGSEVTMIFHIQEGKRSRIGTVHITGNKRISTESILAHVPLVPGKILSYTDLKQAEQNLAELGLFVVDAATGVRPTVTVIDAEGENDRKDLLITVKEKAKAKSKSVKRP